ncbi:MAG: ABC transporter ATP-binding protein, partial [Clostridia bacterium]|nr:ABC transporter ATP-binding protein [Clostridia bacterium]
MEKETKVFSTEERPFLSKERAIIKGKRKFNFKKIWQQTKKILSFGKKHNIYLFWSIFGVIVSTVCDMMIPIFLGRAIDSAVSAGNVNFGSLMNNIHFLLLFAIFSAIFTFMATYFSNLYCFKASNEIREQIFKKFNSVPLKFVDSNQHGDLLSRMINDVDLMTDGYLEGLTSITNGAVTIVATLIFMYILNPLLATVVAVITPMSLIVCFYIAKKSYKLFAEQAKKEGDLNGFLEEYISGDRLITAFNHQDQALEKFQEINEKYYNVSQRADFYSNLSNPTTRFINGFAYCLVAFVGALLALNNPLISIGLISSFLSYANSFGKPFNDLSSEVSQLQAATASTDRIFYILDAVDEPSDAKNKILASVEGNINIEDVNFSYHPNVKLIENFNLSVKKGERIAIVGPTGCGKSTLINLLMRFYDVNSGTILVDGTNIQQVTRNSLRNK